MSEPGIMAWAVAAGVLVGAVAVYRVGRVIVSIIGGILRGKDEG